MPQVFLLCLRIRWNAHMNVCVGINILSQFFHKALVNIAFVEPAPADQSWTESTISSITSFGVDNSVSDRTDTQREGSTALWAHGSKILLIKYGRIAVKPTTPISLRGCNYEESSNQKHEFSRWVPEDFNFRVNWWWTENCWGRGWSTELFPWLRSEISAV